MRIRKMKLISLVLTLGVLVITSSCSNGQTKAPNIMTKIAELKEFKTEERRIDSLIQTGVKAEITVSIINSSFEEEDKGKDISTAFVNEDRGFDAIILYEIKFNGKTNEIISIKSTKKRIR